MPKQDRQALDRNSGLKSPTILISKWITTVTSFPLKVAECLPLPSKEDADPAEAAAPWPAEEVSSHLPHRPLSQKQNPRDFSLSQWEGNPLAHYGHCKLEVQMKEKKMRGEQYQVVLGT